MRTLINIFRIPELRKRVFFTLGVLIIYRLGFFIPLVGVDQSALQSYYESQST
ncbi:MAG TPA: preprotein translocase subunit SecY, partial [Phycisphaerales bacterium]|nr:preprotein translocase subunit SecY [Phycisphaerales bacterium]